VRNPYHPTIRKSDWIGLGLSGVKGIEIYVLWKLGARILCWVTAVPWFHFFIAATILQTLKVSQSYTPDGRSEIDILTGELPTAKLAGGDRKILLQMPENFRRNPLWRLTAWQFYLHSIITCSLCSARKSKAYRYVLLAWISASLANTSANSLPPGKRSRSFGYRWPGRSGVA
jgi:hypothetical protein